MSFRREAHVPRGGPDGGDGGRGGDVVLICDGSLRDLRGLRRRAHYRARDGGPGRGALRHGADGDALVVRVPPGTEARAEEGTLAGRSFDLVADGQRVLVAAGGAGGRGNKRFTNARRQAPHFAERGLEGEDGWLELALKLLADVGLVGLPNAGKSSLLARLTRATPKVAAYPFTTIEPALGVLESDERQLVLADIPGLIAGASSGAGLGDEFLAHIERTRLLVHVLDIAPELSGSAPGGAQPTRGRDGVAALLANYELIERELALHDPRLAALPRIVALSKADLVTAQRTQSAAGELARRLGSERPVLVTSSATGVGMNRLTRELLSRVPRRTDQQRAGGEPALAAAAPARRGEGEHDDALAEHMVFRPAGYSGYTVRRLGDGVFEIVGERVERLVARFDLDNDEAATYVETVLRRRGVLAALRAKGFEPGDELRVGGGAVRLFSQRARRVVPRGHK